MEKELHQGSTTRNSMKSAPKFKPITQGLGLNHFADGMPYQTHKKFKTPTIQPKRMVQFNFPETQKIQIQPKYELPKVEKNKVEVAEVQPVKPAGFLIRTASYLVDLGITLVLFWGIVIGSFSLAGIKLDELLSQRSPLQVLWPLVLLYLVIYLAYFLIQETTWRKSIGKYIMGLQIASPSGMSAGARTLCFLLSFIPFGLGLFWQFFDVKKRCWHDVVTESQVVHEIHS